jgi:hypothetical protein
LLKSWEKDGLIRQRHGHITLIDVPRIEGLAEPHLIIQW